MTQTVVEVSSVPVRPPLVSDCIAFLSAALAKAPPDVSAILSIEADGAWRVVYYRDVTGAEKLASFVGDNPDVTKADLVKVADDIDGVKPSEPTP